MKILIGQNATSYSFVAGTKQITLLGLWTTPVVSAIKILNETQNKVLVAFNKRVAVTITPSGTNFVIDYSANSNAPALVAGDILTIEVSQADKQDLIINAVAVVQTSVNAINNLKTTFINNLTVKYGMIAQYVVTQDGIISLITGATVTKIELGIGNSVNLPLAVLVGNVLIITTTATAPFTLAITNVLASKQFTNSQNYSIAPSRYMYGPTLFQKSDFLNDNLTLSAIGLTSITNGQFNVIKVAPVSIDGYVPVLSSNYFMLLNRTVDYNNKLFFISSSGLSKLDYTTNIVTTVYAVACYNIIKVFISTGVYKLYLSTPNGVVSFNPDTEVATIVNAASCLSVHYHPDSNQVFACPKVGSNLIVIKPLDDSINATIALTGIGANFLSYSIYKTGVNRLFLFNYNQNGGSNIYIINTLNNTHESIIGGNNSFTCGGIYSPISNIVYNFDTSSNLIYKYNPDTLASIPGNLSPGAGPYFALLVGNYMYLMCSGAAKLVVYDLANNHNIIRTDNIAANCYKLFYDSIRNLILAFSVSGNIINEIIP